MVRQTVIVTAIQLLRLFIQGLYFLMLTRLLSPHGYGIFVSVVAASGILAPLCGPGVGELLIMKTARHASSFRLWFAHALTGILACFPVLALVLGAALWALGSAGPVLILCVAASDLLFLRTADVMGQAFQARERTIGYALCGLAVPTARLTGVFALTVAGATPGVAQWGALYAALTAAGAAASLITAGRQLGPVKPIWVLPQVRAGLPFALAVMVERVANDLDKLILISFVPAEQVGLYAAGQRIVELAMAPVRALFASYYPQYFKAPAWEHAKVLSFTRAAVSAGVATGVLFVLGLLVAAPLIPHILGEAYRGTAHVVPYLAALPILFALVIVPADLLSGLGRQVERTGIMGVAVIGQLLLNLVFIPEFGWQAAALNTLAFQAALAVTYWARVLWLFHHRQGSLAVHGR